MATQVCLKWNSFLNNIATSFESLWEEEGLVDVTLASDGQCLTAHKVILSASSPFFKKVFQTNPCQHPVIILQDVHFAELEALLIFIYKGEVNIEEKKLPALLKAAETLQIRGLSGNDCFARDASTKVDEEPPPAEQQSQSCSDESSPKKKRKKQKVLKNNDSSILENVLIPLRTRSASVSESSSEKSPKEIDVDQLPESSDYDPLELKMEPFEVRIEDLEKESEDGTVTERLTLESPTRAPGTSSMPTVTVIPEAAEIHAIYHNYPQVAEYQRRIPDTRDPLDCDNSVDCNPGRPHSSAFSTVPLPESSDCSEAPQMVKSSSVYPPFPCPFCDRAYTSWGFRRRHIKAVHTISPRLNCKWCPKKLSSHAAWKSHVISSHSLSESDAQNGLLILEEAHMVLQIAHPTKLDTLINIIKQNSQTDRSAPD